MAITDRNTTLSRIKADEYDENTSTTSKSIQYSAEGSRVYHDCTISHGSGGKEDEDEMGTVKAIFTSVS